MLAIANMIDKPVWVTVVGKESADAAHFDPKAPLAQRAKILAGKTGDRRGGDQQRRPRQYRSGLHEAG
jgi:hypothetical protein